MPGDKIVGVIVKGMGISVHTTDCNEIGKYLKKDIIFLSWDNKKVGLENYVGSSAGTKLKSTSGWKDGENGTDAYGFSGVPGGERFYNGNFSVIGSYGYWWSSASSDASDAWGRRLLYNNSNVGRYINYKGNGFSVRCVRD